MKPNIISAIILFTLFFISCNKPFSHRREIPLNGSWDLAETFSLDEMPDSFSSQVPVPGLVDLATISMDSIGVNKTARYYWYRRNFTVDGAYPDRVILKINKAKYGTWVYVNGHLSGKNLYCFTPTTLDIKEFMKEPGMENELVVVVGSYSSLPDTISNGWDFEKTKYIPGIYDDVKLLLSGYPYIKNAQVVPDIENENIRVVTYIENSENPVNYKLNYRVRESASGKVVASGTSDVRARVNGVDTVDLEINIENCRLWSPEDPFLYKVEISSPADDYSARFGMREFYLDTVTRRAILNGKPYYMRGTNVCIYRFFEDPQRRALPWDKVWVRDLHETFRTMHWNSMRYCIGFPPEAWYEIADETGFLIQDEFPLWYLDREDQLAPTIKAKHLAAEYREWMQERWNHACVVIWDAQNESYTDETGLAIDMVRDLDLSGRPWDNGWAPPRLLSDVIETHPYVFPPYQFMADDTPLPEEGVMKHHFSEPRRPDNGPDGNNAIIINEYGWLWLNRDGSPTSLTDHVYSMLRPECTTPEARFEAYARFLQMKTEYWRAHRQCAGVLHFCGLGYSRTVEPRGQTSDHFIDLENLVMEPNFVKYVRPAFSPVGLMIDKWDVSYQPEEEITVPVIIINDTYEDWADIVTLSIQKDDQVVVSQPETLTVEKLGQLRKEFTINIPQEKGKYQLVAELKFNTESVKSIRDFEVK